MADPDRDGPYFCHGLMIGVPIPSIAEGNCAFLCPECGKYRHVFPRTDPRRARVGEAMPAILAALQLGSRGDVA